MPWATPTARDAKGESPNQGRCLCREVRWPTPTASEGTGFMSGNNRDHWRPSLALAARWQTPVASDYKSHSPARHATNTQPLRESAGGALNPAWVEALMGFPPGWTALDGPPLPVRSTRGSRRARPKDGR
jgi:DNA (cytosine-5)-methyltransferase 1